ncbi:MAG: histidinol-phosphatase HisJ family protein [Candidatus Choladocola sp.]|nr:histidinol-phosphatase HisJ family protein [Candidatus Choladocola sp.]
MIRYDYHLHSDFSGDSDTPPEQMAAQAVRLGLAGICFTEHEDIDAPVSDTDFTVDFDRYFHKMQELKIQYAGRLKIRAGMEFGLQSHLSQSLNRLTEKYPFDFIIASQHFVNGEDPYYPAFFEGKQERDCYEEFFRVQLDTLKRFSQDSFDTLGHMDYIVRYGPNQNHYYSYEVYADYIDPILKYLIDNGKCLEVNTGGLKYGLGEPNPCTGVLRRYRELGGELITIGSDAHAPQHLCFDFSTVEILLKEIGFRFYTVFENRRPEYIPL